jgi:hypothetical protein
MCDEIQVLRVVIFFVCGVMILTGIFAAHRFCKKKGIDMNKFSGMFEIYRRVFKFEEKAFSILILVCMYGGALLVLTGAGVSIWAQGRGCVFPTAKNRVW